MLDFAVRPTDASSNEDRRNNMRNLRFPAVIRTVLPVLFVLAGLLPAAPVLAQSGVMNVELGKARILRLDATPTVVVVGDPEIADVIVEDNNVIFLMGIMPGETNVYMLDENGDPLLETSLVVTPADQRHVSVHRGVEEQTMSCNPRCAGVANQIAEGAVAPENLATAIAEVNPLTGAATSLAGGAEGGADASSAATQALTNALVNNLAGGGAGAIPDAGQ